MTAGDVPGWGRYEWTTERIAKVKAVADAGGTAVEAAIAVGLDAGSAWALYKLAKREGFKFKNSGRKRSDGAICVNLDEAPARELTLRARARNEDRRQFAAKLLNIVLLQGPTFIDNLLDEGA